MKFLVEWETCYCEDDYADIHSDTVIEAETEEEALKKFVNDERNSMKVVLSISRYAEEREDMYV